MFQNIFLTAAGLIYILPDSNIERYFVKDFIKVIKALSEPDRVKILKMLQRRTIYA